VKRAVVDEGRPGTTPQSGPFTNGFFVADDDGSQTIFICLGKLKATAVGKFLARVRCTGKALSQRGA